MLWGSIVALITPMRANGAVDWPALDALIDWHIESGTHGIVPVGTTGESATLTAEEHKQVVQRAIERAAGHVPVIAGTGANSTAEAIEFTAAAADALSGRAAAAASVAVAAAVALSPTGSGRRWIMLWNSNSVSRRTTCWRSKRPLRASSKESSTGASRQMVVSRRLAKANSRFSARDWRTLGGFTSANRS